MNISVVIIYFDFNDMVKFYHKFICVSRNLPLGLPFGTVIY